MVLPMYKGDVNEMRVLFLVMQKHSFDTLLTLANPGLAIWLLIFETWINVCVFIERSVIHNRLAENTVCE